jgi:hypothetical protein
MALNGVRVQHIAVDTRSPDAVVYIKCVNRGEAGRVYDLLNGFRLGGLHGEWRHVWMHKHFNVQAISRCS